MYDVIIIGAGVSGCAVARELSAYKEKRRYWKDLPMFAREPPRRIAVSSMPDMMRSPERGKQP